ncbi:MAG TPA: DUF1206 domain-containing protein [Kofleriaceae bacterium]|nr:DUF1206 domain-containing protein [Kofleriaceae bacterium]
MTASAISGAADNAIHEAKPWLEKLARAGFVAKGLLYMTIGALATAAALGLGRSTTGQMSAAGHAGPASTMGQRGAMAALLQAPAGRALLIAIAVGLFGYAAWRFIEAIRDPMHHARSENKKKAKGILKRLRSAALGIIQVALGISALKIAFGNIEAANDGKASAHWTGKALATPGGELVLWAIAGGLVAYGVYQLYKAWASKLSKELMLGRLSSGARRLVIGASRFGIAARGIVFATTGILVGRAILQRDPQQVKGIKASLIELLELGRWPFAIVAMGLIAYGIYQLINARYRRIEIA